MRSKGMNILCLLLISVITLFPIGAASADGVEEVVYVANNYGHGLNPDWSTVAMLRGSDLAILDTVTISDDAHSVAVTPDHKQLWVTCREANKITVLDAVTLEILEVLDLGIFVHKPTGIAFTPDGSRAYVTFESLGLVGIFDTETYAHLFPDINVGGDPSYIVFTPDGSKAYVVNTQGPPPQVVAIRTSDNTVVDTFNFGGHALQDAVVSPDGSMVYISNMDLNQIEVIRTSDDTLLAPIFTVTAAPRGIGISPDGEYLFLGHYLVAPSVVNMFRLSDNTIVSTVGVPSNPRRIVVRPDGSRIFVSEHNNDECYAFDVQGENLSFAAVADLNTEPGFQATPVGLAICEQAILPPVGGEAYPINKVVILAPWIALLAAIVAGAAMIMRRRTAQS